MPDRINCPALVQLVTEYIEGAMPSDDVARFEEHLQRCPPCEVYLVQMRRTIEICGKLPAEAISDEAKASLMAAFEDWKVAR
jgi:anti-sigma factor RsiW